MCMNCFPTLAEIKHDHEQLKKAQSFEIQNICRTCDHFKKDDWGDLVGFCDVKKLTVSGVSICSVGAWVAKKE